MTRQVLTFFTAAFIAFGAHIASAQPERGMEMNPERQIKELMAALDISDEQEPAFREAMLKVNAMRMENTGQMRGMREGRRQGRDDDAPHDGHGAGGDQADVNTGQAGLGMQMMVQRRAQMQQKRREILAPVLSAEQLEKYIELENARMEKMMSRMRQ